MDQLSSPPSSARAFAAWLLQKYNNPDCPLGSVALLISDSKPQHYEVRGSARVKVQDARMKNVDPAVMEWKRRADSHSGNLAIFFFCGHGITAGPEMALLLEDFAAEDERPFRGAIDFRRFRLGMDWCKARKQVYFIDACRTASPVLLEKDNTAGDCIIEPSRKSEPGGRAQAPVFYSTLEGAAAYGHEDQPSYYTEALLGALAGAADNRDDPHTWVVETDTLHGSIDFLLRRASEKGIGVVQSNSTQDLSTFSLYRLDSEPHFPVAVGCLPQEANPDANLSYGRLGDIKVAGRGKSWGWDLFLPPGGYSFSATTVDPLPRAGQVEMNVRSPRGAYVKLELKP